MAAMTSGVTVAPNAATATYRIIQSGTGWRSSRVFLSRHEADRVAREWIAQARGTCSYFVVTYR